MPFGNGCRVEGPPLWEGPDSQVWQDFTPRRSFREEFLVHVDPNGLVAALGFDVEGEIDGLGVLDGKLADVVDGATFTDLFHD